MIVWDPDNNEIIGGYRFSKMSTLLVENNLMSPTGKLFEFSQQFKSNFLHKTIELGRSFVQPIYQAKKNIRKGIFALDNLWDGLGAVVV